MKSGFQKYKTASVQSANKEKILLMLYEGAIKFVKRAMQAIDENDIAERGMNIGKAYDIIMELNNTLNHDVGKEIASNLEQLYIYMGDQLTQANITGKRENLENVLKLLTTLHDGWTQAIESLKNKNSSLEK
ncbi:flagellar export chaperone FliS [bacterium]|nr:flagellar export chaperone FliS [bacterium]